jgi:hypothetical protein
MSFSLIICILNILSKRTEKFSQNNLSKSGSIFVSFRFDARMKYFSILTLSILFSIHSSFSQVPDWAWASGAINTSYSYGDEYGTAVATDRNGNLYVTGNIEEDTTIFGNDTLIDDDNTLNPNDIFLAKYDVNGKMIWVELAAKNAVSHGIAIDSKNDIYLTGDLYSKPIFGTDTLNHNGDIFVAAFDPNGKTKWVQTSQTLDRNESNYHSYGVVTDSKDAVYITGPFSSTDDGSLSDTIAFGNDTLFGSSANFFLTKYDSLGNVLWARSANQSGADGASEAIAADSTGNIYITGYFIGTNPIIFGSDSLKQVAPTNVFIAKYNSSGNLEWASNAENNDYVSYNSSYGIAVDSKGDVYITGQFREYLLFGSDTLHANSFDQNLFIAKYDSSGKSIWARNPNDSTKSSGAGYGITADEQGNAYVTGLYAGQLIFEDDTIFSEASNVLIAKYNSSGNAIWAKGSVSPGDDDGNEALAIVRDATGNLLITGLLQNQFTTFDNYTLKNYSKNDGGTIFVAKLSSEVTAINTIKNENSVFVFPNPSSNQITLLFPSNEIGKIQITNMFGEIIFSNKINANKEQINVNGFPNGMYLISFINSHNKIQSKFLKQ